MEEFLLRFPGLGEKIFDQLDNQNLTKCKEVSRSQRQFLEENKVLWKRMIEKYSANNVDFKDSWKLVTEKVPTQIVKELALAVEKFYTFRPHRLESQHSPHHIAAERGSLSLCKFIAQKTKVVNPERSDGLTGLHFAAQEGHFDVCQYLIEDLENKNPRDKDGRTPLQLAGMNGHIEIFKLIMENQSEKNPKFGCCGRTLLHGVAGAGYLDVFKYMSLRLGHLNPTSDSGKTPLHEAAQEGKFEVVKYIVDLLNGTEHVNPASIHGWTPLHLAAHNGHFKVFEYIAERVSDLDVERSDGYTSLHLAASEGHFEIVRYIVGIVNDKNPVNAEGNTPLHETAKKGHLEIYKCIADQVDKKNPIYKNPVNNEGTTPLHEAARKGHIGICKLILDYGVDPHVKNNAMHSALDLASTKEFRDLIRKKSKKIELSKKRKLDESKENIVLI